MTKVAELREFEITPGVMPATDATASDIPCWTEMLHVRFDPTTGRIRKIGGWNSQTFDYDETITGTMRTIYSATINQKVYTIIGTQCYLYGLVGSRLANITPLTTVSIPVANSLSTHYGTLANNPIGTESGSNYITVSDADAARYQVNDNYTLSGATTTNGIPNTELNAKHVIRSIGSGTVTFRVASTANATGSGGGASVVRSDGLIRVTDATTDVTDGQRVKITGAADTGGILAADINLEFIARSATATYFDVMTNGTSTSSVTGAGGASTEYYPQIACGSLNQGLGQGYGAGLYGVGLYGTALQSQLGETYPRIWFADRFGDNIVLTAGNESEAYVWNGDTTVAPTVILNAPTDINYLFVSDNILVTFGHDVENKIFASDQGDYTQWTASATNQVFEDIIEGAGRFISHAPIDNGNLIFCEQQTYTFKYIGGTAIWQTKLLDASIGLIAPMARVSVNGIAYWMGQENFYMFRGGKIEVMPSNISSQPSILRYVYDDFNYSQRYKMFAWYNEDFDEIWFHYPSAQSNECDRIARWSRKLQCWALDYIDRTAAEYPAQNLSNPRLGNVSTLYVHEAGANDDGAPMEWYARSRKFVTGKDTAILGQFVPDNTMTGTAYFDMRLYNYPQSQTAMNEVSYNFTSTTERVPAQLNGRYWDMEIGGDDLNQTYLMGQWMTEPQKAATAP